MQSDPLSNLSLSLPPSLGPYMSLKHTTGFRALFVSKTGLFVRAPAGRGILLALKAYTVKFIYNC